MRRLLEHINNRNKFLPVDILPIRDELQNVFQKNILSAGVLQPGYFNDFHNILLSYKNSGIISRYMITEEEYTDNDKFYKIPVIDVIKSSEQSNIRIFLTPL
jgi:hypothetical protein